jgi:hypothetical protein
MGSQLQPLRMIAISGVIQSWRAVQPDDPDQGVEAAEKHRAACDGVSPAPVQKDQLGILVEQLGSLGLTDDDCRQISGFAESAAAGWHAECHEDAFNQTSVIIGCSKVSHLEQALVASRIGSCYFLDEVRGAAFHQLGEFQTLSALLERLRKRLVCSSALQTIGHIEKMHKDVHRWTRQQARSTGSIDDGQVGISGLARHAVPVVSCR